MYQYIFLNKIFLIYIFIYHIKAISFELDEKDEKADSRLYNNLAKKISERWNSELTIKIKKESLSENEILTN